VCIGGGGRDRAPAKKLGATTIATDREVYERQIQATDQEIDALVYGLCGLAEEEIGIVEGRDA
jgi:hypothetical protein